MKVGVLTVHCSINAGASLQAYALCRTLSKLGFEPEIIDYRPHYFTDEMDEIKLSQPRPLKTRIAQILLRNKLMKEHNAYVEFEEKFLPIKTKRYNTFNDLVADPPKYDAYICGSDQIWNPQHIQHDRAMFLSFLSANANTASYAASIGQDVLSEVDLTFIKDNIDHFNYISVREQTAKELIDGLETGKQVTTNIDPTLLLSKEEWAAIESDAYKAIPGEYIVYYPLADNPITDSILKTMKERYQLPIVALTRKIKKIANVDFQVRNFSPQDFLAYMHHAKYVVTNSFHGSVFSMIFRKPLVSYKNPIRNSRLECLFDLFGTNTIQIDSDDLVRRLSVSEPNKIVANENLLQLERRKAFDYLMQLKEE